MQKTDPNQTTSQEQCETHLSNFYQRNHNSYDLSSVRAGLGDAAVICDSIAIDIAAEHTICGKQTKLGMELVSAVKRAANAVWAMRDKIAK